MDAEEVCLKWSNFSSNITRNIDELWKDESLVDVTICSEGQCIQAHKVILSASSPLFKGIFAVNPCQHPVVILQDVKYRELSTIIKFIYKGEVNIDQQYLPELLKAAKTLQIRGLSDSVSTLNQEEHSLSTDPLNHQQQQGKKRKTDDEHEQNTDTFNQPMIIPKEEIELNEYIPPDIETNLSDEEDVKDLRLDSDLGENSQLMTTQPENHAVFIKINPPRRRSKMPNPSRLLQRHFPSLIPPTKKDKPTKRCTVCYQKGIRKESRYWCEDCKIGLCPAPCFHIYHTYE